MSDQNPDVRALVEKGTFKGTRELNEEWVEIITQAEMTDDDKTGNPQAKEVTATTTDKEKNAAKDAKKAPQKKTGNAMRTRSQKQHDFNMSPVEQKALMQYDPDLVKGDEILGAFLTGFRCKQDYNEHRMREFLDQLESCINKLVSVTTSITRAAGDMVSAAGNSASIIATAITDLLSKIPRKKRKSIGTSFDFSVLKKQKEGIVIQEIVEGTENPEGDAGLNVDMVLDLTETEEGGDDLKKTEGRIKGVEEGKSARENEKKQIDSEKLKMAAVPKKREKMTKEELVDIMGNEINDLKKFYEVKDKHVEEIMNFYYGPLSVLSEAFGGRVALKGSIKKTFMQFKKKCANEAKEKGKVEKASDKEEVASKPEVSGDKAEK